MANRDRQSRKSEHEAESSDYPRHEREEHASARHVIPSSAVEEAPSLLTSAALIGVGALIEPGLLPGMAIGASIVYASRWFPDLISVVRPLTKSVVKAGYAAATAATEAIAEMSESVEDMMAEVRAEQETPENLH